MFVDPGHATSLELGAMTSLLSPLAIVLEGQGCARDEFFFRVISMASFTISTSIVFLPQKPLQLANLLA